MGKMKVLAKLPVNWIYDVFGDTDATVEERTLFEETVAKMLPDDVYWSYGDEIVGTEDSAFSQDDLDRIMLKAWNKWVEKDMFAGETEIVDLRAILNLTQKEFSEKYEIPLRTIENWEGKKTNPPKYVFELLKRCVMEDHERERA